MSKDALFGWIGGKSMLRKQIAEYVPEQDLPISKRSINHYVEVRTGCLQPKRRHGCLQQDVVASAEQEVRQALV